MLNIIKTMNSDREYYQRKDLNKIKKAELIALLIKYQDHIGQLERINKTLATEVKDIKAEFSDFSFKNFIKVKKVQDNFSQS